MSTVLFVQFTESSLLDKYATPQSPYYQGPFGFSVIFFAWITVIIFASGMFHFSIQSEFRSLLSLATVTVSNLVQVNILGTIQLKVGKTKNK